MSKQTPVMIGVDPEVSEKNGPVKYASGCLGCVRLPVVMMFSPQAQQSIRLPKFEVLHLPCCRVTGSRAEVQAPTMIAPESLNSSGTLRARTRRPLRSRKLSRFESPL